MIRKWVVVRMVGGVVMTHECVDGILYKDACGTEVFVLTRL